MHRARSLGYVLAGLSLAGCTLPGRAVLSPEQELHAEKLEERVASMYTPEARSALEDSPFSIWNHGPSMLLYGSVPDGTYSRQDHHRRLDVRFLDMENTAMSIILHEDMHYFTDIGMIEVDRFMEIYSGMLLELPQSARDEIDAEVSSNYEVPRSVVEREVKRAYCFYPIKSMVELQIEKYDPHTSNTNAERISYFVQFWIVNNYDIPPEMVDVFSPVFSDSPSIFLDK